jgi:glycosyltransferase involved in cell wall biosynthesis
MAPQVSVICISYNHGLFVREALDSVAGQTYAPVELLIVDNGSTDNTVSVIRDWMVFHPGARFFPQEKNRGICKAFNLALDKAQGKYIIDLSADDVLLPNRVERGVALLEQRPEVGVQFSDAELIDPKGNTLGLHSDRFPHAGIPQGKIFREILTRYFINSPTMMMRRSLLVDLGGYDERLAYEDFDFWVRSTPQTHYAYLPETLVRRRVLPGSMGKEQHRKGSTQSLSTLAVCRKAHALCTAAEDFRALRTRVSYELRQALRLGSLSLAFAYIRLWWLSR